MSFRQPEATTAGQPLYHQTLVRLAVGLLGVDVFLIFSHQFSWFDLDEYKGWPVLIAITVAALATLSVVVLFPVCALRGIRFRFGIRSLLLLTLAVAIPCAWCAIAASDANRQKNVVATIQRKGGEVQYDWQTEGGSGKPPGPAWLLRYCGTDFVSVVVAVQGRHGDFGSDWDWTDADMVHLQTLSDLRQLNLQGTQVTDAGLVHIKHLTELERLNLNLTKISDSGLARLRRLNRLEDLELAATSVTDDSLMQIGRLTRLWRLNLAHTKVTDNGLKQIGQLTNLRSLDLSRTGVTEEGASELRASLPNCSVYLE